MDRVVLVPSPTAVYIYRKSRHLSYYEQ